MAGFARRWNELDRHASAYVYGDTVVIKGFRRELYEFFWSNTGPTRWQRIFKKSSWNDPCQGEVSEIVCWNRVFKWSVPAGNRPSTSY